MSAFTEWNGPQNSGPSTAKITELIESFNQLSSKLQHHIDDSVNDPAHPHAASAAIQDAVNEINTALNSYLQKTAAAETYLSKSDASRDYVTKEQAADYATNSNIAQTYETKAEAANTYDALETKATAHQAYNTLTTLIDNLRSDLTDAEFHWTNEDQVATYDGVIKALDAIKGYIKAHRIIDFTKWQLVSCQFAGTGSQEDTKTNGLYVIGKLSHNWEDDDHAPHDSIFKAARAFIKYENGHPFDAIVDMTATRDQNNKYTGSITAQVSKKGAVYNERGEITENGEWSNLRFHLVHATSYDNTDINEVYLCLSADGLWKGSPYLGDYSNLRLHVAGINFIPLDDNETKRVTLVSAPITWTTAVPINADNATIFSNMSASEIVTDSIKDTEGHNLVRVDHIHDELDKDHPVVTLGDPMTAFMQFWKRPVLISPDENGVPRRDRFITLRDIQDIKGMPVGVTVLWPKFEFVKTGTYTDPMDNKIDVGHYNAIDIPEGWHASDGTMINVTVYTEYGKIVPSGRLPFCDFCITKIKDDLTNIPDDLEPDVVLSYNELSDLLKLLSKRLRLEAAERMSKDTDLTNAINTESQARIDADNVLLENDKTLKRLVANTYQAGAQGAMAAAMAGGVLTPISTTAAETAILHTLSNAYSDYYNNANINSPSGEPVNIPAPEVDFNTEELNQELTEENDIANRVTALETSIAETNSRLDMLTQLVQQLVENQQQQQGDEP